MLQAEASAFADTITTVYDGMHSVVAQQGRHKQQSMAATYEQLWFPLLRWKVENHLVLCNCSANIGSKEEEAEQVAQTWLVMRGLP